MRKNWHPLVLGPLFAIDTTPLLSERRGGEGRRGEEDRGGEGKIREERM